MFCAYNPIKLDNIDHISVRYVSVWALGKIPNIAHTINGTLWRKSSSGIVLCLNRILAVVDKANN